MIRRTSVHSQEKYLLYDKNMVPLYLAQRRRRPRTSVSQTVKSDLKIKHFALNVNKDNEWKYSLSTREMSLSRNNVIVCRVVGDSGNVPWATQRVIRS